MKTNMGTTDRVVRLFIALLILSLYFLNVITGTLALAGLGVATIILITVIFGYCPLYTPFGISTVKKKNTTP